ncbi:MAG: hypothetical protein REI96_20630 [Flavobacterium nitrogenifigens]|uniref:hypothetical protein n=1 Tax=Flavobacterium nitrogenifigens TaxID=1617283 RepID=UPI002809C44F|nr:hypothetical protein [Flavobacterium nitrogenifigens]MDQ8014866.1 hypothetical protein [Flavobacterium nitrogenifigens]
MGENKLHIVPKPSKGQKYDPSRGCIVLNGTEKLYVTIREYEEDEKKIKILIDKKRQVKDYARQKWTDHAKEGWSEKKLKENYEANMKACNELDKQIESLQKKYDDINWCYQLVGKKLDPSNLSHNEFFSKGILQIKANGSRGVHFGKILLGGGMAWLEAYHQGDVASGKVPYGVYVQGYGTPKVLDAVWTDFKYNPISGKVGFESKLILHVYTSAMYGQKVEISLMERNWTSANKEVDISGEKAFVREVKVMEAKEIDGGKNGVSGKLISEGLSEPYVQKIEVEVFIDPAWDKSNLGVIDLYPRIKVLETGAYFEEFPEERCYLEVNKLSRVKTAPIEVSNKPSVVHTIETNVGAFHNCQYTGILLKLDGEDKERELYKEDPSINQNPNIEVGLILGSNPKKFSIRVDKESDTKECRLKDGPKNHKKSIFTFDQLKLPKNVTILDQKPVKIDFESWFDYSVFDNSEWALKYIWPTKNIIDSKIKTLGITADTCRHHHNINLTVFPDIKWELAFMFALKNPLAYTYSAGKDNKDVDDKAKRDLIYADAHKKAYNSGNDRNKLRQGKEIDSEFFLTLKGKFNKVESTFPTRYENEQEYGAKFAQKVSDFLDILAKLKSIANNTKNAAGGAARNPKSRLGNAVDNDPFSFEILSPKVGGVIQWEAEEIKEGVHKGAVCTTGTLKLVADPLIGAEFTVNMLAVASKMNPIVYTIKKGIDVGLDALGGYMKLDLKFYGALNITIEALKINSLEGVKLSDKPAKIDGKMGIELIFRLYASGKIEAWGCDVQLSFSAEASAHAYFGGTAVIKADSKGIYADIEGKFSGLLFSAKFEIKVGKYFKKVSINNEVVLPDEIFPLGVYYLT